MTWAKQKTNESRIGRLVVSFFWCHEQVKLAKKFRTFKNLKIVFSYSRMKNLGAGKSSKLVLKIMKHAMNPSLAGLAERMGQVVQYLAEIAVTSYPLKNLLLLCPGSQTTVMVQRELMTLVISTNTDTSVGQTEEPRISTNTDTSVRQTEEPSQATVPIPPVKQTNKHLLLLCSPPILQNFSQHFLLQTK